MNTLIAATSTTLTNQQAAYALLGASAMAMTLVAIVLYVIYIIAFWKIFTKAGEAGWKSIIPFYNMYVQLKLTWETKFFWIMLALAVVVGVCESLVTGKTDASMIFSVVSLVALIALLVLDVMALHNLSKSFGHGAGYTVGLFFLPFIFTLILGFSSDKYIGNGSKL